MKSASCALLALVAAACGGTSPEMTANSAISQNATGGGGAGGGGGTGGGAGGGGGGGTVDSCGGLQFFAPLYFVDQPLANEPALGGYVYVFCKTWTNLPSDLIVSVNGVPLVKVSQTNFRANAAGPQVSLGADGMLHVLAASASTGKSKALDIPCADLIPLSSDPVAGSSLTGLPSVAFDWAQLPQNAQTSILFMGWVYSQPTLQLDSYDPSTNRAAGVIDQPYITQDSMGATALLRTQTASTAYLAALTYPGVMAAVPDLSTFGYCGRSARVTFAR